MEIKVTIVDAAELTKPTIVDEAELTKLKEELEKAIDDVERKYPNAMKLLADA